jgi:peptide/nickel transport system substrate-binding protein
MDQASIETNPAKRAALYHEFQKLVVEAAPVVWVHELKFSTVTQKDLKDAVVSPLGVFSNLDQAYFEK